METTGGGRQAPLGAVRRLARLYFFVCFPVLERAWASVLVGLGRMLSEPHGRLYYKYRWLGAIGGVLRRGGGEETSAREPSSAGKPINRVDVTAARGEIAAAGRASG